MATRVKLHPETPHRKRIFEVVDALNDGAVILMPTDTQYALACDYRNKEGINRIRQIRNMGKKDHLTVMCHSLQHASVFARMNDRNFKLVKRLIPGSYTCILPATREVPKLLVHPRKKTVGIRVPDYPICRDLIETLDRPLMAITARLDHTDHGTPDASGDREMYLSRFNKLVDLIIDNQQPLNDQESTILDLTGEDPELLREGPGMERLQEALALEGENLVTPSEQDL